MVTSLRLANSWEDHHKNMIRKFIKLYFRIVNSIQSNNQPKKTKENHWENTICPIETQLYQNKIKEIEWENQKGEMGYREIIRIGGMRSKIGGWWGPKAKKQTHDAITRPAHTSEMQKFCNLRNGLAAISTYDPSSENKNSLSTSTSFPSSNRYACKLLTDSAQHTPTKKPTKRFKNHSVPETPTTKSTTGKTPRK